MSGRRSALHDRHSSFVQVVGSSLDPRIALTALQYFDQRCAQVTEVAKGAYTSRNSVRDVPNRPELIFDAVCHQLVVQGSSLECEVEVAPSAPPDCITRMIKMRPHWAYTDMSPLMWSHHPAAHKPSWSENSACHEHSRRGFL